MTTSETAAALRDPIGDTGGRFMLDGATYVAGMSAGFAGLDLYVCGRCGALGPVDADVVIAQLGFFEPGNVATNWAAGQQVMPIDGAAALFMGCSYTWAREHFDPALDATRLAELFGWSEPHPDPGPAKAAWAAAETATNDHVAGVLGVLSETEQRELVALATVAAGR